MTFALTLRSPLQWAGYASLALVVTSSAPATAQTIGNARPVTLAPAAPVTFGPGNPVDMLSMHLRTLAIAPRSLSALLGAGDSALAVGDPNAALGFYARAEEVDGRSGKAKAGLASALVMLERADDALPLFAQAVSLGVPEWDVAGDRGLAYDLRGDSRRAQRDYALALKHGPDDETTRRYALSLGISGDRAGALVLLDPLLRKQDQSAWRARAFILAMTGDVAGANGIARQVMPANLAATMSPFLTRLPQLNAADKAHAVAFGTMPSAGTNMASVEIGDPFHAIGNTGSPSVSPGAADGLIPAGRALGPSTANVPAARVTTRQARRQAGREVLTMTAPAAAPAAVAPVRAPLQMVQSVPARVLPAPGFTTPVPQPAPSRPDTRVGTPVAMVDRTKLPPEARGETASATLVTGTVLPPPSAAAPVASQATPAPTEPDMTPAFEVAPLSKSTSVFGPPAPTVTTATLAPSTPRAPSPAPAPSPVQVPAQIVRAPTPAPITPPAARPVRMSRLASIMAGLTPEPETPAAKLPTAAEVRAARRLAQRKAAEAAAVAADLKAEKEAKAALAAEARRNPARLWVQVATGSNVSGLPTTWSRIRADNETALKGRVAWSMPYKATNRLLVGPMKSPAEARALVNTLAKDGLSANTFSSEVGQEVTRIGAK